MLEKSCNCMINNESKPYKLILTSKGLNTKTGMELVKRVYQKEKICYGSIFLLTLPVYGVDKIIIDACKKLGFDNIYLAKDYQNKKIEEMPIVDAVFVTEGNTFEVAEYIRQNNFDKYIRNIIENGITYIGSSAGAILASASFEEAENFDSNFIKMTDFTGLKIMPENENVSDIVIPHYTYRELQNYINSMEEEQVVCYRTIYNVCNEEALVLDCKRVGNNVELIKKRRIRVE